MAEEAAKWEEKARRASAVAEGQAVRVRDLESRLEVPPPRTPDLDPDPPWTSVRRPF